MFFGARLGQESGQAMTRLPFDNGPPSHPAARIHLMDEACALQDIFGHSVSARSRGRGERGESGVWDLDRLTEQEEQEYLKKHAC